MSKMKHKAKSESAFGAAAAARRPSQIALLSPAERRARGVMRAIDDAKAAAARCLKASAAQIERAEAYTAQVEQLEAELAELEAAAAEEAADGEAEDA